MPATKVLIYKDADGHVPLLEWLADLDKKARARCIERIERLAQLGHDLRRPEAATLRDGIYELRARAGRVQLRILYMFVGQQLVVLSHGITKEGRVPDVEIERALERGRRFREDPKRHTTTETWT